MEPDRRSSDSQPSIAALEAAELVSAILVAAPLPDLLRLLRSTITGCDAGGYACSQVVASLHLQIERQIQDGDIDPTAIARHLEVWRHILRNGLDAEAARPLILELHALREAPGRRRSRG